MELANCVPGIPIINPNFIGDREEQIKDQQIVAMDFNEDSRGRSKDSRKQ